MITKDTKMISPTKDGNWKINWKTYEDGEKLYVLKYLDRVYSEGGDNFIIHNDDPFSKDEKKFIIDVMGGRKETASEKMKRLKIFRKLE